MSELITDSGVHSFIHSLCNKLLGYVECGLELISEALGLAAGLANEGMGSGPLPCLSLRTGRNLLLPVFCWPPYARTLRQKDHLLPPEHCQSTLH